jgi:hypothetical protein
LPTFVDEEQSSSITMLHSSTSSTNLTRFIHGQSWLRPVTLSLPEHE